MPRAWCKTPLITLLLISEWLPQVSFCPKGLSSGSHLFTELWAYSFAMRSWVIFPWEGDLTEQFTFRLFIGDEKTRLILKAR